MASIEFAVDAGDVALPATLSLPDGRARGGIVALHGSGHGERTYVLYEHLAHVLPPQGIAVLRFDRRPTEGGGDVPLEDQATDALAAIAALRESIGDAPIGLWGFSQGGWAAPYAAVRAPSEIAFLVAVSASGVSPAAQMRYGTAEQLRRNGYDEADLAELASLRALFEAYLRGDLARGAAQEAVDRVAEQPWFPLVYVPSVLPELGAWRDMDFDPEPIFTAVTCPVLAFYGEADAWVPIDTSAPVWGRLHSPDGGPGATVVRLAGCDHEPLLEGREDLASVSPAYTHELLRWLDVVLSKG